MVLNYPNNYVFLFDINNPVARDDDYNFLYSLKGDKKKEHKLLISGGKDDHDGPQLCIQKGYEIPLTGELTGGILGDGFIDRQAINDIVELSQYPDIIVSKEVFNKKIHFLYLSLL